MAEFPCPNCGAAVGPPGPYLSYNGAPRKAVCDCPACDIPLAFAEGGAEWRFDEGVKSHRHPLSSGLGTYAAPLTRSDSRAA
jgi:hypothetical protein